MKNLMSLLDPQTYGLNRGVVVFGLLTAAGVTFACVKLLAVLREAGLPSVQ